MLILCTCILYVSHLHDCILIYIQWALFWSSKHLSSYYIPQKHKGMPLTKTACACASDICCPHPMEAIITGKSLEMERV